MPDGTCCVKDCERPRANVASGMCQTHYRRQRKGLDLYAPIVKGRKPSEQRPCAEPECGQASYARRLCVSHYNKAWRSGLTVTCQVEGCDRVVRSNSVCGMHYGRIAAHGAPGENAPRRTPNGNGHINRDGYRVLNLRKGGAGAVLEHRQVMADHLRRPLRTDETVHHKNGQRADNRLENLELWSSWQPPGQRVDDKIAWALNLLRVYSPESLSGNEVTDLPS